ncbi:hypothetical protein KJ891_04790, partial [Candidatus Micrarchaeota archaeon]|nr:hypothetical protein [Candidatus Micrarchaeota archaeon]
TKEFGQVIPGIQEAPDENFVDYYMLDYRNPDNLFMATGTFSEFDYNTGAYLLTASANEVDFNISTNGIYNDHNNWDTNRYSPAFEISSYTASTRPLMRLNNVDLNEGIDFVADVNTEGQYAVVVWLGSLTAHDQNAQLQMAASWNTVPVVTISSPADGSSVAGNSLFVQYTGSSDDGISKYYVKIDSNAWIDNGTSTSYTFRDLNYYQHTFSVRATDIYDRNSADVNATVTITIRNTQDGTISRADTTPKKEVKVPVEEVPVEVILQQTAIVYEQTAREVRNVMQEYGIPQEQVSQAVAMAGQVSLIRSIEVTRKAERDSAVITISVHNKSSKPMEDVTVIERIPKDVAETAEEVASTYSFVVIEEDPVLRFFVGTVLPGETKDVKYTIHKKVSEDTFFSMQAPIAAASAFVGMVGKAYTLLSSYYRYIPDMKEITVTLDNAGIDPAKAEEVQELSEGLGIYKGATVIADEKGGQVTYRTNFVVKIVNSTENTLRGVTIIENVPAGVAESANILEIEGKHRVLVRSPPMLEFELGDLKAGESASVHYSVGRKVENIEMENLPSPIVLADVEEAGTGARSDAGLIIAIAAVAIILIAGILYFLRGKYSLDFKGH